MRRIHPKQIFNQGQGGFTLIELMIVVAVAGILAVIGFPLYRQHTMKSNRAAAEAFMLQVANRQEQYILNARTFAPYDAAAVNPFASLNLAVPDNVKANYQVQMTPNTGSPSNTYYTITATPIGGQVADTVCGIIALDQTATKGSLCSATSGDVNVTTSSSGSVMQCTGSASVCW
ncbi:MAG TPA: type IV pilin protein [Gallionellaceae bacterium]|nr:type IV pilin protein [Gallionellaceae bacterium]